MNLDEKEGTARGPLMMTSADEKHVNLFLACLFIHYYWKTGGIIYPNPR